MLSCTASEEASLVNKSALRSASDEFCFHAFRVLVQIVVVCMWFHVNVVWPMYALLDNIAWCTVLPIP